jgi:hypothetical protein
VGTNSHPASATLILFGGSTFVANGPALADPESSDLWGWTGRGWSQISGHSTNTQDMPAARYIAGLANDDATQQLVLFGGVSGLTFLEGAGAFSVRGDTWVPTADRSLPGP